eukprot:Phypoly_transcript_01025.p1 GENE.Phypoly_transcript_01025~~Phypoly_transcript_01025.p1  ORF type:complete len:1165 (+),score=182.52 Phypoly_transcript_01025:289-3495(+)
MKKDALSILARGTKDMMVEQIYIKEKVATLVVEIAKRDWPQQWDDLLNNLVQISMMGDTQAELILLVLRTLPDEIVVFNDTTTTSSSSSVLTEQRKKDLMAGINQGLAALFSLFYSMLEKNFSSFLTNKTTNAQTAKRSLHLVLAVLRTLLSYLEWVPLNFIFENNIHSALCQLIKEEGARLSACECLLVTMSRKCTQHERYKLLFPFEYLDILVGSMNVTTNDSEADYGYHKRLGQTLTFLGTNVLKVPSDKKLPSDFEKYLHVMLAFSNHPSILLSSYTIPFWIQCYQTDFVLKLPYFNALQLPIMKMAEIKMSKHGDPEKESNETAKYSAIDFGTSSDFVLFVGQFRQKLNELVKHIAAKMPDMSLEYCAVRLPEIISSHTPASQEMTDPAYLAFEAYANFLNCAIVGIPSEILAVNTEVREIKVEEVEVEDVTKEKTIAFIEAILKCLLEYNTTHLMIIQTQLNCLHALTPYYAKNPASLQFVFGKVLPFITFRQASEPLSSQILSLDTISLRRKAIHVIMGLGNHIPTAVLSFLPQLLEMAQQMSQQGLLLDTEKVFLTEALVMISNGMKNFEKQSAFLQNMMASFEADWTSPIISEAVLSPTNLLLFIGAVPNPTESAAVYEERRKKLQNMVHIFQAIYKRVTVPTDSKEIEEGGYGPHIAHGLSFASRWPVSQHHLVVLPNVMKMTRTLHGLWDPAVRAIVPAEYQPMYSLDEPTVQSLLGKDREYKQRNMTGDQTLRYLRNVLDACREGCYSIIGNAAIHGEEFWTMNGISAALLESVCSYLEVIENRHLRSLLKNFGESFVQNCPEKLRPTLLDPILPPLFNAVFAHLNSSYSEIINRPNKPATDPKGEIAEIVEDKILHELAHVYLDFIQSYIDVKHTYHASEVLLPIIYTVLGCLGWPDGTVCRRGVHTATKLIPTLLGDSNYHQLLGREMIITAIRALAANRNPDNNFDLLGLIKDIYVQMKPVSILPQKTLQELPNITQDVLDKLNNQLRANSHDAKVQRNLFKVLLQERSGINFHNARHQPTILDIPPSNFFSKVEDKPYIDKTSNLELQNLFD